MSLTRAMLKGMGLTDEQVSAIIEEHTSVTDALKEQRNKFKEDAEKLPGVQKEYDDLKKDYDDLKAGVDNDEWEKKYNKEHEEFEKYKSEIADKEQTAKVTEAYKKLLTECKVGEKHIGSILKVTNFKDLKLKEDGTLDGVDDLKKKIEEDWSGFISSTETHGADVETPPGGDGGKGGEGGKSRAAELAKKYRENLYGKEE